MDLKFEMNNYEFFNDYKDLMIEAFGIGCSTCGAPEILYVFKGGPIPIGTLIKKAGRNLSDDQIEQLIAQPLQDWQQFDDQNSENLIPTYLCGECWNTIQE